MSEYTPTTEEVRGDYATFQLPAHGGDFRTEYAEGVAEFDRWLAAHDAEVRAEAESDPAKDERLVRYMAMATPLGYQPALTVVQQMTALIDAETRARAAGVVTEEPEWEYTRQAEANGWAGPAAYRDEAHASDGLMPGWRVVRRRKAGPWVPVKQEGTD